MRAILLILMSWNLAALANEKKESVKPTDVKAYCNKVLLENQNLMKEEKGICATAEFKTVAEGQQQHFTNCKGNSLTVRYLTVPPSEGLKGYKSCTIEKVGKNNGYIAFSIKTIRTPFAEMVVDEAMGTAIIKLNTGEKISYRYEAGAQNALEPALARRGQLQMPLKDLSSDDIKKLLSGGAVKFVELGQLRPAQADSQFGTFTDDVKTADSAASR